MAFELEMTNEARDWYLALSDRDQQAIGAAIDMVAEKGPSLGRPVVDAIKGSRHSNMKEARSVGGHLRALFAFDPRRTAIVLLGGDKRGDWTAWYERNVPLADDLYDEYLDELRREGLI